MPNKDQTAHFELLNGVRIIVVIGAFELGGAERQALLLARHLAHEQKADLEVWGYGEPGRVSELCDEQEIAWRSVPVPVPWSSRRSEQIKRLAIFARTLRRARPDVILPFMFFQSVACGLVWRRTGARTCIWNQRDEGRDRLRFADRLAVRFTPRFVANSQNGAQFLINDLGVDSKRLTLIHNGVEITSGKWDRAKWRAHLGVSDEAFLACMVANLQQFKDHDTLLKAWRIVVDHLQSMGREAVLLLAGRPEETHLTLKTLAFDLNLGNTVRFLGGVKDIMGLLSAVDVGTHSSVNEGVPNGVLECMAAGLPVAGTNYLGIREALGPQGDEFLAPPHDAAALAEQIIRLALDPVLRRDAGAANRLRVETEFSPRKMFREMTSLIHDELHSKQVAPGLPATPIALENSEIG